MHIKNPNNMVKKGEFEKKNEFSIPFYSNNMYLCFKLSRLTNIEEIAKL